MKKENQNELYAALSLLGAFVLWTVAICFIDVHPIGPNESAVGFAAMNCFFHELTGVHMTLYIITDWLGLVPLAITMGFALLGLIQWIRRKRLRKVDASILILGGFYLVVMAVYLFFEYVIINYRPVLLAGVLEASYPSSTTMLAMCVMPTAMHQLRCRIRHPILRRWILLFLAGFTVFMVVGRLISGVHWLSDIVGGALLSAGLVMLYDTICKVNADISA